MNISIEESTTENLPSNLSEIIKNLLLQNKAPDYLQKDFLFVVIIIVMLENGFQPIDQKTLKPIEIIDTEQLMKWKTHNGMFEASFIVSAFEEIHLKLVMIPLGSTAIINLLISDFNSETYSVCLPVGRYVVSPQASTIPMIFRDLKHLSTTLKNKILAPTKSRVLNYYGYPSASLVGLPEEVLQKIILYLPVGSILNFLKVCRKLKFVVENDSLWHELYKRDFAISEEQQVNNWKAKYKEAYEAEKEKSLRNISSQRFSGLPYPSFSWDILL